MAFGPRKMEPEMPAHESVAAEPTTKTGACRCGNCRGGYMGSDFGRKIIITLVGVLLVYTIVYVGSLMRNNLKQYDYIGVADASERTVTVTGYGKMNGKNDIAMTTIGYTNTDKDVAKAQNDNKKIMDQVLSDLKKMGIEEKDLESDYSIYPQYDYTQSGSQFKGYQVTNNIRVKIRDLTKVPEVLGLAGKYGANSVSGLSFTMDDTQALKDQARVKALTDAKTKAQKLAQSLGMRLIEVVSYNEYEGSVENPYPMANNFGMGGADAKESIPTVASGSQDVVMNVNLTYKIAPTNW